MTKKKATAKQDDALRGEDALTHYVRRMTEALEALVVIQTERVSARGVHLSQMAQVVQAVLIRNAENSGQGHLIRPQEGEQVDGRAKDD